ncbi:hypothetical protein [Streptomyces echinatus]|uniref:hypothetical protein n=1 Tax=Streptomyces echinatus TaxID=67293 RepID=UPI0037FC5C91
MTTGAGPEATMRLRTSERDRPGYGRVRSGRGFRYTDATGGRLTDPQQVARIRALTIPMRRARGRRGSGPRLAGSAAGRG